MDVYIVLEGRWLDGSILKACFSRLFELTDNKSTNVAEMHFLGWEVNGEAYEAVCVGGWFAEEVYVVMQVEGRWLDGSILEACFSRLFELMDNKSTNVADMHFLGWGVNGET